MCMAVLQNSAEAYTHPCMGLTNADLATLNANKSTGQWAAGYTLFNNTNLTKLTYVQAGPFAEVGRTPNINLGQWRADMNAIFGLALNWKLTGDNAYAEKAKTIALAWAATHTVFSGSESYLDIGDYVANYALGYSILRSYSGWTTANTSTAKNYFANVLYPAVRVDLAIRSANQGGAHLKGAMAVAVYNDDTNLFNQVVDAYRTNSCVGLRTTQNNGQVGDSGRDAGHWRGELYHYAWVCEVALKAAGVDLFRENNNRMLAAAELFADWNGGGNPAFIKSSPCYFDVFSQFSTFSPGSRAPQTNPNFLHIFHGAYVIRKGLSMPKASPYRANQTDDWTTWIWRKATDSSGVGSALAVVPFPATAPTNSLGNLTRVDIGDALPASTVGYNNGTWTVTAGGADMWGTIGSDSFTYVYKAVTGNTALIARVTGVGAASAPMAGVMFRESLAANSRMAMTINFKGTSSELRPGVDGLGISTRGADSNDHGINYRYHPNGAVPYWVKVERFGDLVTLFSSPDGVNWSPSKSAKFYNLPSTYYLGLAVCSRANGTATTATFTNVSITGVGGFPPAGTYSLKNRGNDLVLDSWGRTANGSNCAIAWDNPSVNQNWTLSYVSSNVVKLRALGGSLMLDGMGRTTNGSICGLYADNTSNNQRWTIVDAGNGYYKLVNVGTGLAFDVGASPWANGDNLEQWPNGGSFNTQWQFVAP